jgi:hypothetical protein
MSIKSVSLGSAGSAVGCHLITGGTNATPIVMTVAANSGLKSGDRVAISGITGNTAMNGEWTLAAVTATTFQLVGSVGNGTYGGTPRLALMFDRTPTMRNHSALMTLGGNAVATLLLEAFENYDDFAAGSNASLGAVGAPVQSSAYSFVTNVNATSASAVTIASSSIVMAATAEAVPLELKLPRYLRVSLSAWTSGTFLGLVAA